MYSTENTGILPSKPVYTVSGKTSRFFPFLVVQHISATKRRASLWLGFQEGQIQSDGSVPPSIIRHRHRRLRHNLFRVSVVVSCVISAPIAT